MIILPVTHFLTSQMNNKPIKLTKKDVLSSCVYLQSSPGCHLKQSFLFVSGERTKQPTRPVLKCVNNLIYLSSVLVIHWFTPTWLSGFIILQLTLKKKPQNHSAVARRGAYFAEKADTSKRPPHPFYSQASSFANLGSAWLLQGVSWPRVPGVIHHYPNLTELWAHRAKPLIFICRLQPHT